MAKQRINLFFIGLLSIFLTLSLPLQSFADTPPAPPSQPNVPNAPAMPEKPAAPPAPPTAPKVADSGQNQPTPPKDTTNITGGSDQNTPIQNNNPSPSSAPSTASQTPQPSQEVSQGTIGNTNVKTGQAETISTTDTKANTNRVGQNTTPTPLSPTERSVGNVGNATGSSNNASSTSNTASQLAQTNANSVTNTLQGASVTGKNDASLGVGNATIQTGNANTSGTAITSLNTNTNGVMVNQFDVNDNHNGDIVLDVSQPGHCISGCGANSPNVVENIANGESSTNSASATNSVTDNTFQHNDATVGSNVTLSSDSGNNSANNNTGGNSTITTGNANTQANVLTFANNNIDGRVVYTTVNIYGNLVGDIGMPQSVMDKVGSTADNTGNGHGSSNSATLDNSSSHATFQSNDADIQNNLTLSAVTGGNSENNDTGGNASVTTGQASVHTKVLNIANSNVDSGNVWLVIINNAGKWIGKILGAPDKATSAASSGVTLSTDSNGNVSASNTGNAAGSQNSASDTLNTKTITSQDNKAKIVNNITLSANTGKNSANDNTGGNSSITTGNAQIIANLVNFVNDNIKVGGKLFVTVINVFGSWIGNFVPPGQTETGTSSQQVQVTSSSQVSPVPTATLQSSMQTNTSQTAKLAMVNYTRVNYPVTRYAYTPKRVFTHIITTKAHAPVVQVVAGLRTERKPLSINLAWLVIIIPLMGILVYLKKQLFLYK